MNSTAIHLRTETINPSVTAVERPPTLWTKIGYLFGAYVKVVRNEGELQKNFYVNYSPLK